MESTLELAEKFLMRYKDYLSQRFGQSWSLSKLLITFVFAKMQEKKANVYRLNLNGRYKGYETHLDGNKMIIFSERLLLLFHFSTSRKLKDNWEYIFRAIAPVGLK